MERRKFRERGGRKLEEPGYQGECGAPFLVITIYAHCLETTTSKIAILVAQPPFFLFGVDTGRTYIRRHYSGGC